MDHVSPLVARFVEARNLELDPGNDVGVDGRASAAPRPLISFPKIKVEIQKMIFLIISSKSWVQKEGEWGNFGE